MITLQSHQLEKRGARYAVMKTQQWLLQGCAYEGLPQGDPEYSVKKRKYDEIWKDPLSLFMGHTMLLKHVSLVMDITAYCMSKQDLP